MTSGTLFLMTGEAFSAEERMSGEVTLELIDRYLLDARGRCREIKQTLDWLKLHLRIEQKSLRACSARLSDLENRARLARRTGSEVLGTHIEAAITEQEKEEDALHLRVSDLESRLAVTRFTLQRKRRRLVELKRARDIALRRRSAAAQV
jgi:phage shock protein A